MRKQAIGKGYLRRSARHVPLPLGIRENTRMTVTLREELFSIYRPRFIASERKRYLLLTTGGLPVFYFTFSEKHFLS